MRRLALALALLATPAAAQDITYPPSVRQTVFLNDIVLAQSALVSVQVAGVQTFTVSSNCQAGDRMVMTADPGAVPAGYLLGDIACAAAGGSATAKLYTPQLAIGVSYSITVHVTAFR